MEEIIVDEVLLAAGVIIGCLLGAIVSWVCIYAYKRRMEYD